MSLTPPKPVPCKGCGKPIVWVDKKPDGSWARPSDFDVEENEKLGIHDCPNYKPKPKQSEGGGWSGTNKQGQMFEARVSQDLQQAETRNNELILKMLADISKKQHDDREKLEAIATNVLEILGLLQDQFIKKQEQQEKREEPSTQSDRSDYGF